MDPIKILIVEDNIIVAEDIKQTLEQQDNIIPTIANSAKKAMAIVEQGEIDIALMDINLGQSNKDGIEVASELRNQYGIAIIYLTAHVDKATVERAKKTEPLGYLVKPFDENELRTTIEVALYKYTADLKIKKSEQWLRTTLQSIGEGVITTDQSGIVNYMNPVAEKLTGWPLNEGVNKPIEDVVALENEATGKKHPHIADTILKDTAYAAQSIHGLLIHRTGKRTPVTCIGNPILLADRNIMGTVLVIHDDTRNRRAENAIRLSESKYRSFLDNFQGIAFKRNADFGFDFIAGTIEDITGYTMADFLSQRIKYKELIHPEDKKILLKQTHEFFSSNRRSLINEYRIIDKQKNVHWLSEHISKVEAEKGKPCIEGIIQDITKRKMAESQSQLLHIAVDNAAESVAITDAMGTIQYVNQAFVESSGYSRDELIGENPRILKSDEHPSTFYQEMWDTLNSQKTWEGVFINRKKDGSLYHEKEIISPVLNKELKTTHYIAVKRDITEELIKDKMIKQSQKMEAIGTLAGGIAHDFNNILSPIIGFAQLSMNSVEKGSILEDNLLEINKAAMRAKDLVHQILTFARKSDQKATPIKIHPIVKESLKFLRSSVPASVEIKSDIDNTAHVVADPTQVHQILMNLCTNAYHAVGDTSGVIEVSLKDVTYDEIDSKMAVKSLNNGNHVLLTVADNGKGIAPDHIDFIFEPYFTTKDIGEGTGLGLAVCEGAIRNMNGEIFVESRPGQTIFSIYLPATDDPHKNFKERCDTAELPKGTERILFVDDEVSITKMGEKILTGLGYSVTTVNSSIKAASLFREDPDYFDLVVTDMTMPDITGDRLASEIKSIKPSIPIILCTGFSKKISEDEIENLGINGYCRKPISIPAMAKKVRRLLDQSNQTMVKTQ